MRKTIPLLLTALLLLSGCGDTGKPASGTAAAEVKPVYVMSGKIDSVNQAEVTTKISAKVAQILVDVGSKVQQGQPVVILDTRDLEAQVKQAQAAVSTAQANLDSITAGARPAQIDQAQAAVDSAKQSYTTAKANLDRTRQLFEAGAASLQQVESAQTQLAAAGAQYQSAQDQLALLKQGATPEAISVGQKQVQQAQAALETAKTQLANGTITAPVSGTVTAKKINTGELASPGATLVSIVNNGSICVNAYLPAEMLPQVKTGQKVLVKVSELPGKTYDGEVTVINAEISAQNQDVLVKVGVPNPNGVLKNGMFAEIAFKK